MGQKTNPKAFRLVTTEKHLSTWYSNKNIYSEVLKEDYLARQHIEKVFENFLVLSKIEILRRGGENTKAHSVRLKVFSLFPRSKDMYRKVIAYFEKINDENLQKALALLINKKAKLLPFVKLLLKRLSFDLIAELEKQTQSEYILSFHFIRNPFEDPTLIAKYISGQLEKRVPFRRVVKQCLKKVALTSAKGIKIQLSGRLNGIEIARSEWKRQGKIPLHTLKAKIDYVKHEAQTIYGVIGIKIWLFTK